MYFMYQYMIIIMKECEDQEANIYPFFRENLFRVWSQFMIIKPTRTSVMEVSYVFFFQRHVKGFAWGDECKMLVIWHIEDQQWIESLLCSFVSTKRTVVVNFYDKQDTLRQEVQLDWFSEGKHPSNRSI